MIELTAGDLEPGEFFRRTGDRTTRFYMLTHRPSKWGSYRGATPQHQYVLANVWGTTTDLRVFGSRIPADTWVERLDLDDVGVLIDDLITGRRPSPLEGLMPA